MIKRIDSIFEEQFEVTTDQDYSKSLPILSDYVENVCSYIGGYVVRKLLP